MAVGATGIYFGLRWFMQDERAFLLALSAYLFYALIDNRSDNWRDTWFWIALPFFALIHLVALSTVKLPQFEGPSLLIAAPFMFLDGFAMWGLLNWLERRLSKNSAQ